MEVTFLGTGAGMPSKERNVSALVLNLLQEINELWLFDCGEAAQHQLLHTTLKPRKIRKIFITHLHGDHIFGLPGLLSSRSFLDGDEPVTIYGPKGIKQFIEMSLTISRTHLTYEINCIEIEQEGIVFEDDRFRVDMIKLTHNIPSYAYKIIEKDRIGELQVAKLRALGIEPGPLYRQIKENEETVLPDGRIIYREDVVGAPKKGKKIVIFGDTRYDEKHASFALGADLIIHEATFSHELKDLAKQYYHATAYEAAQLAKKAQAKQLILNHISSRYQGTLLQELLQEAKRIFPKTLVAKDLFTYNIS